MKSILQCFMDFCLLASVGATLIVQNASSATNPPCAPFYNLDADGHETAPTECATPLYTLSNLPVSLVRGTPQPFTRPEGGAHWYEAVYLPNGGLNWLQARALAEEAGGYLATITSDAEGAHIFSLIDDPKYWYQWDSTHNYVMSGPFLGGYQPGQSAEPSGGWRWVSGEAFSYTHWCRDGVEGDQDPRNNNQPNDASGGQDVIAFGEVNAPVSYWGDFPHSVGGLNDQGSDTKVYGFIIEYDANPLTTDASTAIGVFRAGTWFLDANSNGAWDGCQQEDDQHLCLYNNSFGAGGDLPVTGNWDGSAHSSIGVLRSTTGEWFIDSNGNRQWDGCVADGCYVFGMVGDWPVAGDWNETGFAKLGVFRNGQWYLDANGNGAWDGCDTELCLSFGQAGDLPVVGNWDGSTKAGVGVFRSGTWYLDYNGNGQWDSCQQDGGQDRCYIGSFGMKGDWPVAGDWNSDGRAKVGVFRDGTWYLDYNGNGQWDGCQQGGGQDRCYIDSFGMKGDLPVTGNW